MEVEASTAQVVIEQNQAAELECLAYHQSGHAAAAFRLGRAVRRVTILPDETADRLGAWCKTPVGRWFRPDVQTDGRTRNWIEREVIVSLAGGFAEAKRTGRHQQVDSTQAFQTAYDLLSRLCSTDDEAAAYWKLLSIRARQLVRLEPVWRGVEALVAALLEEERLTGREAKRIFRAAATSPASSSTGETVLPDGSVQLYFRPHPK